jgi:hypothetical protein
VGDSGRGRLRCLFVSCWSTVGQGRAVAIERPTMEPLGPQGEGAGGTPCLTRWLASKPTMTAVPGSSTLLKITMSLSPTAFVFQQQLIGSKPPPWNFFGEEGWGSLPE